MPQSCQQAGESLSQSKAHKKDEESAILVYAEPAVAWKDVDGGSGITKYGIAHYS